MFRNTALFFTAIFAFSNAFSDTTAVDLLVYGDYVVTMDAEAGVIKDGAIAIDGGTIVFVGAADDAKRLYRGRETFDGHNRVVLPGLINGHTHAGMTLFRGLADDISLASWLNDYMFPAENRFADEDFVRLSTELACWEMIKGGTTTFVDMYYFPDVVAEVVDSCGLRALIAATIIDKESPDSKDAEQSLEQAEAFVSRWKNRNTRITPIFGPHANFTLTAEQLKKTRDAAIQHGAAISIHVSESDFMNSYSMDQYGEPNITMLDRIGLFDAHTIAAHVVWPTTEEIPILAAKNVGVIHNPSSNMKLASGVAPVSELLEQGVAVGLGTDSTASNNDLDMWEEIHLAALLPKGFKLRPEEMPALTALQLATSGGARAIGLENVVGSLTRGKRADVIQLSLDGPRNVPIYDVVSHLAYVSNYDDVITTIVDGAVLMRNREVLTLDTDRITKQSKIIAREIATHLNK